MVRRFLYVSVFLSMLSLHAQSASMMAADEGIWQGYDGEWRYVSRLLVSMADAIPADKYAWRPASGTRSVSEVLMHIAQANFYLLSATGPKMPHELERDDVEKTIVSKPEVMMYLRRSLEAVKTARAQLKPGELERKVMIEGESANVDGMYLRIICHDNGIWDSSLLMRAPTGLCRPRRRVLFFPSRRLDSCISLISQKDHARLMWRSFGTAMGVGVVYRKMRVLPTTTSS